MEDEGRPLLLDMSSNQMQPLPWDPRRAKISGIFILVSVALERLAYYAVVMNLFLYLNRGQPEKQAWEPIEALTAVFIIHGLSCISSPVGGWFSDSLIGRFWTIVLGMLIYISGYSLLTALAINRLKPLGCDWQMMADINITNKSNFHWHVMGIINASDCSTHIYAILILVGIGVGFLRANIPPFGAEQVRAGGDHSVREFFNTYYWCINIGGLLGVGVLAYVEQNIEDGFFISFLFATVALCISLVCFCAGRRYYVIHRPGSLVIFNIFRIIWEGVYNSCKKHDSIQGSPMFRRHQQLITPIALAPSWIDRAKVSFGGSFHDATVDDIKHVAKNLVFISVLIPYWLVYSQISTSFQAQGLHMNLHLNESVNPEFEVPSAWLTLCDQLFILVLLPFVSLVIYPFMDRKHMCTSPLRRIIVGMFISLLAVLVAAIVEHFRLQEWRKGNIVIQEISGALYNASGLSILYQIPQYCLIGTAEVFAGVAGLEHAYTTSPRTFQGIIMGLYASMEGLGSFLSALLVQMTRALRLGWIRNEAHFNEGHIDYFFYLLAIIQSFVIIILGLVMYLRWEPTPPNPQVETILGSSALHSEFHRSSEVSASQVPSPQ